MLEKLARAAARREPIRRTGTDALRLCDGAADDLPDLEIDDFAGRWLVQSRERTQFPEELREAHPKGSVYWKPLGEQEPPRLMAGPEEAGPFLVMENGLRFEVDFSAGSSQGLFLDQRDNRAFLRQRAAGKSVLNTFAYTCSFGVALAAGGAHVTNLDLSRNYLTWGRRNFEANAIDPGAHDFIYGDCFDWMGRLARKGRRFDLVILDPPTFSRDDRGRVFRVERDLPELVRRAVALLTPGGAIFVSTNLRKLHPLEFRRLSKEGLERVEGWQWRDLPMPPDFTGEPYLKSALITVSE